MFLLECGSLYHKQNYIGFIGSGTFPVTLCRKSAVFVFETRTNKFSFLRLLKHRLCSYPCVNVHYNHAYDFFTLMSTIKVIDGFSQREAEFKAFISPLPPSVTQNCNIVADYYCCLAGRLLWRRNYSLLTLPPLFHGPYIIPFNAASNGGSVSQVGLLWLVVRK